MPFFSAPSVYDKLRVLDERLHALLLGRPEAFEPVPVEPARDVEIVRARELPPKPGLLRPEGQVRLLHDLANIELQAMELGVRTLTEFPDAPKEFREELAEVTRSEGQHLKMCLESIDSMGFSWGIWPVHTGLWAAVKPEDELVQRILCVHRHMEGSGLDAGDALLRKLSGVGPTLARAAVARIVREEVGHVDFGSRWFRVVCKSEGLDPDAEFRSRMPAIVRSSPRKDILVPDLRRAAGFTDTELEVLEGLLDELPGSKPRSSHQVGGSASSLLEATLAAPFRREPV